MNNIIENFEIAAEKAEAWHSIEYPTHSNRLKKLLLHPMKYFFYQLSKRRPITVPAKTFFGDKFLCYLPDYFLLWCYGIIGDPAEIKLTRFLIKNIKEGDVFIDAGSNCGFYSVLGAKLVGDSGSVHAFEPTPKMFNFLYRNVSKLKNVKAMNMALSDKIGQAALFTDPIHPVNNSLSEKQDGDQYIMVETTSLDAYSKLNNIHPTFIKMDVEGAEDLLVKGGREVFSVSSPLVAMEILVRHGKIFSGAINNLINLGYAPNKILPNGDLEPITLHEILDKITPTKEYFNNFIFKK